VNITEVKPETIRVTLRTYLAGCEAKGEEPVSETYQFCQLAKNALKIDFSELRKWDQSSAAAKFQAQVLGALNKLAADGLLVKVLDRSPRRVLRFITPQAAKHRDEQELAAQAAAYRYAMQVQGLGDRLRALGVDPLVQSGAPIRLDTEDWEILVRLAERAKQNEIVK
jgi:hypothetical protein